MYLSKLEKSLARKKMCYYSNIFTLGAFATYTKNPNPHCFQDVVALRWISMVELISKISPFVPNALQPLKHSTFITCPNREHVEWFITSQQRDFPFTNTSVPANFHSPSAASQQLKCSTAIVKWKVKSGNNNNSTAQHKKSSIIVETLFKPRSHSDRYESLNPRPSLVRV